MKIWKKLLVMGMLGVTALGATGCGKAAEETTEVHIGYFNNITHAQALLMKSEQSLENAYGDEAQVSWTAFNAGPAEVEALFAGDIDIGYIGPVPAISAYAKSGGDVVILSGATKGGAVLVTGQDSEIKSVADLSGKTVAIPQIGNTQYVTVTAVANADVANMMERGDIDAALVPEPWGATLEEQGAKILLDYDEIYMEGNYDVAVVVVRKEFMEEHPDLVEKFLQEHEAATAKINDDQEGSLTAINQELDAATGKALSESIIKKAFERMEVSAEMNRDSIMGFADISKQQELIDEVPEEASLFAE